jgi:hypothetical protein
MSLLIISRYFSRVGTEQRNKLNREKRETFIQLYAKTLLWRDYSFTHGINIVTDCFYQIQLSKDTYYTLADYVEEWK